MVYLPFVKELNKYKMEETNSKLEDLANHAKEYLNTNAELIELKTTHRLAAVVSTMMASGILLLIMLIFFLFASVAVAYYIASVTGKMYLGFLIVAAAYLILGLFLWAGKEKLLNKPIMNAIIKQIFKDRNEEQD